MAKKGYPGLILVPPSDRTVLRRRVVRWSLLILAVLWGASTFNTWLSSSQHQDCEPRDTANDSSKAQEDCTDSVQSAPEAQPLPNPIDAPAKAQNTETVEPTGSPESPAATSPEAITELTTDHTSNTHSPAPLHNTPDSTMSVPAGQESITHHPPDPPANDKRAGHAPNSSAPTQILSPSTAPPSTHPDHKIAPHTPNGNRSSSTPSQPVEPTHAATDHKSAGQPGSDAGKPHRLTPPVKTTSTLSDPKPLVDTSTGSARTRTPSPSAGSLPASPDRKITVHALPGIKLSQTPPQPGGSAQTSADHKPAGQPGSGSATPHALTPPAKSASSSSDHKAATRTPSSSTPNQATSPSPPTPLTADHKILAQSGNESSPNQGLDQSVLNISHDSRLAEEGDAFAQYRLGRLYAQQNGRRSPDAVKWYKKASAGLRRLANGGNGQAMYILGVMYAYGRGVSRNPNEARLWLNQAVDRKISAARPVLASLEHD